MTLIEQEFVIKKCEEEFTSLYHKLYERDTRGYLIYKYYSEEKREIDLNRCEELKKMLPKLRAAFDRNLEKACQEIINDKI